MLHKLEERCHGRAALAELLRACLVHLSAGESLSFVRIKIKEQKITRDERGYECIRGRWKAKGLVYGWEYGGTKSSQKKRKELESSGQGVAKLAITWAEKPNKCSFSHNKS